MRADPSADAPGDVAAPPPGDLPARLTSLVGRAPALEALEALLEQTRLLTLVGPGGSGKSRLALALAHRRRAAFPDGACWVDLSGAAEPELVGEVVATALGGDRARDAEPSDTVVRRLGARHALLVLDNCEHVVDACAQLARNLLATCPELSLLATSRQPLRTPGEQLWRVPGLSPEGAAELFLARARLAAPAIELTADDAGTVARICRSLDGMPLAIELAAAKVSVLSVGQIAQRLERDTRFLRSPSRTAPPRHRSIEATLEWSHRFLAPAEQTLLRRLSVFAGGFSLPAVEAVCAGSGVGQHDVLDALAQLVDNSLVQVDEHGAERRYRLPETVRQFAAQRLAAAGDAPALQARHARYGLELLRAETASTRSSHSRASP
jgi:predicted ATPase